MFSPLHSAARRRPVPNALDPRGFPVVPNGLYLKGANVCMRVEDVTTPADNDDAWAGLWGATDGPGFTLADLTVQVDHALDMDCNYVRVMGTLQARIGGTLTQNNYETNVRAFLDYCRAHSVFVQWTFCPSQQLRDTRVSLPDRPIIPTSDILAYIKLDALILADYADIVFAVDPLQEVLTLEYGYPVGTNQDALSHEDTVALVRATYSEFKKWLPSRIKVACSGLQANFDDASLIVGSHALREDTKGAWDYLDFHIYAPSFTTGNVDSLQTAYPRYTFIVGEWGQNLSATHGMAPSTASDMLTHSYTRGGAIWSLRDFFTTPDSERWGTHADNGTIRQKGIDYRDLINP
jgi:hypothetical protein